MGLPSTAPVAVTAPRPYLPDGRDPHQHFRKVFGADVLKLAPNAAIFTRAQANQYFITADPDDTVLFEKLHPLGGTERYDWYVVAEDRSLTYLAVPEKVSSWRDRPEAVKFGWLRDPATIPQPSVDARAEFLVANQNRQLAYERMAARYRELKHRAAGVLPPPLEEHEQDELDMLEADMIKLANEGPPTLG